MHIFKPFLLFPECNILVLEIDLVLWNDKVMNTNSYHLDHVFYTSQNKNKLDMEEYQLCTNSSGLV